MRFCTPNYRRYGPGYGFKDAPETGCTCPLCGLDVAWRDEPWDKDADGFVCHEECLKNKEEEWETA